MIFTTCRLFVAVALEGILYVEAGVTSGQEETIRRENPRIRQKVIANISCEHGSLYVQEEGQDRVHVRLGANQLALYTRDYLEKYSEKKS